MTPSLNPPWPWSFRLELPIRVQSPNLRASCWRVAAARRKRERQAVAGRWLALIASAYRLDLQRHVSSGGRMVVTLTRIGAGTMDGDNLQAAFKAVRDQVTQELGLSNDADPRLAWLYQQERCARGKFGVRIRVEPVPPPGATP